jgi:antitoxin component YwqK of YwqJK toxin-antitoxin module
VNAAGHRHGPYRLWDKDGRVLTECSYSDDVPDGFCSNASYGGNGGEAGTYVHGRREGEWKFWREDGVIRMTQTFRGGTQHGLETHFAPDGSPSSYACYQRGTLLWNEDSRGASRACQPD